MWCTDEATLLSSLRDNNSTAQELFFEKLSDKDLNPRTIPWRRK
jgi:hypothetical protein